MTFLYNILHKTTASSEKISFKRKIEAACKFGLCYGYVQRCDTFHTPNFSESPSMKAHRSINFSFSSSRVLS